MAASNLTPASQTIHIQPTIHPPRVRLLYSPTRFINLLAPSPSRSPAVWAAVSAGPAVDSALVPLARRLCTPSTPLQLGPLAEGTRAHPYAVCPCLLSSAIGSPLETSHPSTRSLVLLVMPSSPQAMHSGTQAHTPAFWIVDPAVSASAHRTAETLAWQVSSPFCLSYLLAEIWSRDLLIDCNVCLSDYTIVYNVTCKHPLYS